MLIIMLMRDKFQNTRNIVLLDFSIPISHNIWLQKIIGVEKKKENKSQFFCLVER